MQLKQGLLIFSEILHVLLFNAFESVCGNRFILSESVDININVRESLDSTCSEKLEISFFINIKVTKQTKEKLCRH